MHIIIRGKLTKEGLTTEDPDSDRWPQNKCASKEVCWHAASQELIPCFLLHGVCVWEREKEGERERERDFAGERGLSSL